MAYATQSQHFARHIRRPERSFSMVSLIVQHTLQVPDLLTQPTFLLYEVHVEHQLLPADLIIDAHALVYDTEVNYTLPTIPDLLVDPLQLTYVSHAEHVLSPVDLIILPTSQITYETGQIVQYALIPPEILIEPVSLQYESGIDHALTPVDIVLDFVPFSYEATIDHQMTAIDLIIEVPILVITSGVEPVQVWKIPNRQCDARVDSTNFILQQPGEQLRIGFDVSGQLEMNEGTVASVVSITDEGNGWSTFPPEITENIISFINTVPDPPGFSGGATEGDVNYELTYLDDKGNRHIADGWLRVRET